MALDIQLANEGGGHRRVRLAGRLDTVTAPELDTRLAPLLGDPAVTAVILDLAALEYISSAGIRCVVQDSQGPRGPRGKPGAREPPAPRPEGVRHREGAAPEPDLRQRGRARRLPRHDAAPRPARLTSRARRPPGRLPDPLRGVVGRGMGPRSHTPRTTGCLDWHRWLATLAPLDHPGLGIRATCLSFARGH